jgi:hypothetical protein
VRLELTDRPHALIGVDLVRGSEHPGGKAAGLGDALQCDDVLGEARATPADAGVQEVGTDPRVQADRLRHPRDVGTELLGDPGDLVDEGHSHGEQAVRGVLRELCARGVRDDERDLPGRSVTVADHPVQLGGERRATIGA